MIGEQYVIFNYQKCLFPFVSETNILSYLTNHNVTTQTDPPLLNFDTLSYKLKTWSKEREREREYSLFIFLKFDYKVKTVIFHLSFELLQKVPYFFSTITLMMFKVLYTSSRIMTFKILFIF